MLLENQYQYSIVSWGAGDDGSRVLHNTVQCEVKTYGHGGKVKWVRLSYCSAAWTAWRQLGGENGLESDTNGIIVTPRPSQSSTNHLPSLTRRFLSQRSRSIWVHTVIPCVTATRAIFIPSGGWCETRIWEELGIERLRQEGVRVARKVTVQIVVWLSVTGVTGLHM